MVKHIKKEKKKVKPKPRMNCDHLPLHPTRHHPAFGRSFAPVALGVRHGPVVGRHAPVRAGPAGGAGGAGLANALIRPRPHPLPCHGRQRRGWGQIRALAAATATAAPTRPYLGDSLRRGVVIDIDWEQPAWGDMGCGSGSGWIPTMSGYVQVQSIGLQR